MQPSDLPERWSSRITVDESGCWIWTGALDGQGYGSTKHDGKLTCAHRAIYETLVGEIPPWLQCDHICRVRRCVNPVHIELVSQRENTLRGVGHTAVNAVKTHCKRGHLFDEANTIRLSGDRRQCRTCKTLHSRGLL